MIRYNKPDRVINLVWFDRVYNLKFVNRYNKPDRIRIHSYGWKWGGLWVKTVIPRPAPRGQLLHPPRPSPARIFTRIRPVRVMRVKWVKWVSSGCKLKKITQEKKTQK